MAQPAELTPAESFILLWALDGGAAMLWELRQMALLSRASGELSTIGPGAVLPDPAERFRLARKSALSLLQKGLIAVRPVSPHLEEGATLPLAEARHELEKGNNWLLPRDRERGTYFSLELTDEGEEQLGSIRREDIPVVEGDILNSFQRRS